MERNEHKKDEEIDELIEQAEKIMGDLSETVEDMKSILAGVLGQDPGHGEQ
jgi:hypothetical protein